MNIEINSIFKVITYSYWHPNNRPMSYSKISVDEYNVTYFSSLQDVERFIKSEGRQYAKWTSQGIESALYAFAVYELPLGLGLGMDHHYLSFRLYLRDGSLWCTNSYANYVPEDANSETTMFWRRKNAFWGRKPEEIKFKPGDIVEILGCVGNMFWDNNTITLGIVVNTPYTVDQIAQMKEEYLATHDGFDVTETGMAYKFDSSLDMYSILVPSIEGVDIVPTICALEPTLSISPQRRAALKKLFENYECKYDNCNGKKT